MIQIQNQRKIGTSPKPHQFQAKAWEEVKGFLTQLRINEKDGLERIAALAATESATIPGLACGAVKYQGGYANANKFLQMDE